MKHEKKVLGVMAGLFMLAYFFPLGTPAVHDAVIDAFRMVQWYAKFHTIPCVVPAMFIAGAIASFLSKEGILKHLGPKAGKIKAYGVASVSGTILAVCSCSVLPMFAGIYKVGAGLGPASAFLVSGPALNVMAIFLTAGVLGFELGAARTILAVLLSLIVGGGMALIFHRSEEERTRVVMQLPDPVPTGRKAWQTGLFIAAMILFLVFSDWVNPGTKVLTIGQGAAVTRLDRVKGNSLTAVSQDLRLETSVMQETNGDMKFQIQRVISGFDTLSAAEQSIFLPGNQFLIEKKYVADSEDRVPDNCRLSAAIYRYRWAFCFLIGFAILAMAFRWFKKEELADWMAQTWSFAKTIVPLLFGGVFVTGFVASLVPAAFVARWVGGNHLGACFFASIAGTMWYFATLTEIPLLQALMDLGMGKGPAIALLLAGPTLSLPSIIVIGRYLGVKKTAVFVGFVVVLSTLFGVLYGNLF